jgi:N-acetylneuraminic acid mutarotase
MINNKMVLYGGFVAGQRVSEIWEFNFETLEWTQILAKNQAPLCRVGHSAVLYTDKMYIFGGKDDDNRKLNDLWTFNFTSMLWTEIQTEHPPCVRLN